MNGITEYKVIKAFEVFDKMFLENDTVYATGSIRFMNGKTDYANKIFDAQRNYLGWINNDVFERQYKYYLESI